MIIPAAAIDDADDNFEAENDQSYRSFSNNVIFPQKNVRRSLISQGNIPNKGRNLRKK